MEVQVAAPSAESAVTVWFVQVVPAYSAKVPSAPVSVSAEVSGVTVNPEATDRAVVDANGKTDAVPSPLKVVVEVRPTEKVFNAERTVEEAFANDWSAVQLLAFPMFRFTVAAADSDPEF